MSKFFRSIAPAVALGGAAIAIVAVLDPAIARQGEEDAALASGAMPLATQEPSPEQSQVVTQIQILQIPQVIRRRLKLQQWNQPRVLPEIKVRPRVRHATTPKM